MGQEAVALISLAVIVGVVYGITRFIRRRKI